MNQILMMENQKNKKKKSSSSDTKTIVRVFAIMLIVFGIVFIGKGSYGVYKVAKGSDTSNLPKVSITRLNSNVILKVRGINNIENVRYNWSDSQETKLEVDGKYIEEEIMLPFENSILQVIVEEESGRAVKYKKEFNIEGLDITEPKIEISEDSTPGNIKITATDETEMAYITYKVNDEDVVKIEKSELESKTMNYILKIERGENNIVVTAVDTSKNIAKKEQKIIVSSEPKIKTLDIRDGKLIVPAEDQDGISKVEVNVNGKFYEAKDINRKEVEIPIPIEKGKNTIRVKITNVNSLSVEGALEFDYDQ